MNFRNYFSSIEITVIRNHTNLIPWFSEPSNLMNYKPQNGGWSILEILEHISLTSHFLLIIIEKGTKKALRKALVEDYKAIVSNTLFDLSKLHSIGEHNSFLWNRPDHMVPQGLISADEISQTLHKQEVSCLQHLQELKSGEGVLQVTTMTVNNLGKLNVYEYIYFLCMHIERHIEQMEGVKKEWIAKH